MNERLWLAWLVKARLVIITLVFAIELALVRFTPAAAALSLFVEVITLWYTIAVFFLLLPRLWDAARLQARLQVLTDLAFATAVVYATGGINSSFAFLYPLIIIIAAILLPRYWAFLSAALSFILYGCLLELIFFGLITSISSARPEIRFVQATILIDLLAYLAIAYLTSVLASKLRTVNVELQRKSGALEDLQALHEHIVKSMVGGVIITDLEGCICFVNPAGERILGRSLTKLTGTPLASLFTDTLPRLGAARRELTLPGPDQHEKIVGMTVCDLIMPSTGVAGAVYTFTDLTPIRSLEREVQMRDRMSALGRLASAIAHEIRNPLSSIAGSAQMLGASPACDPDDRELLQIIRRESQRLNQIIGDFLAYSRDKQYRFAPTDLGALLEDTLKLLANRPECAGGGVQLVRRFQAGQAFSEVDGDRLKQVFWNLCDNALRAMPRGGTLTVSVRASGPDWQIGFADTGAGMPKQTQERIFEPFHSEFANGTGLGLAIVYEIVQAHQGRLTVDSTLGKGTEFVLQLKRALPAHTLPGQAQLGQTAGGATAASASSWSASCR